MRNIVMATVIIRVRNNDLNSTRFLNEIYDTLITFYKRIYFKYDCLFVVNSHVETKDPCTGSNKEAVT